jgi:hypothetical protein
MGTRHLIAVVVDGEPRIAQYGQWDGYLKGQGTTIVAFLQGVDLEAFKEKVRKTKMLTQEEVTARWKASGADGEWVSMEVAAKFKESWEHLSRDSGAKTLDYVMAAENPEVLPSSWDFAADSLFCEYAYVIDLDGGFFEVYKGFQEAPHTDGRFHMLEADQDHRTAAYYPVRLIEKFPIRAIPENWIERVEAHDLERLAFEKAEGVTP